MMNKVLVIEDDPALRESVVQTLELADLEAIPTNSFTQARRSIRSNFRGVILSDIKMPDHTGFDVLNFVQNRDEDLPVILLTGYSDVPTALRALREGAYDYLEKPCDPDRLTETIRRALNFREVIFENRNYRDKLAGKSKDEKSGTLSEQLRRHEKEIIEHALSTENGRVCQAAIQLGIPRNTLYDKMTRLGLVARKFRNKTKD